MSPLPRIVNRSSGLGSMDQVADRSNNFYGVLVPAYRASKAALSMLTLHFAKVSKDTGKVKSCDPGYCAMNLNGVSGDE